MFLENTIEKCLDNFKSNHRTAVRKAEKSGIQIRQSEDFTSFFSILKKNLSIRHNVEPTHTLEELIHQLVNIYHSNINANAIIGIQLETKYMGPTTLVVTIYIIRSNDQDMPRTIQFN